MYGGDVTAGTLLAAASMDGRFLTPTSRGGDLAPPMRSMMGKSIFQPTGGGLLHPSESR
jgi:hypothetical protein